MGTRDLFNEDDMLFIDYDGNGKMGAGEALAISDDMGMGDALSIDPDKSESFDAGGTGMFKVYYMPGGKGAINHGAMINLTATVDYSDPSAIDEAPAKSSTTLNFDGVGSPVMAYAIPHSTNGTGDKGNVRVRCEASMGCRVFLECWDDMGMRGFGEAPMIAGNNVMVWSGEAIEGVTGGARARLRPRCRKPVVEAAPPGPCCAAVATPATCPRSPPDGGRCRRAPDSGRCSTSSRSHVNGDRKFPICGD